MATNCMIQQIFEKTGAFSGIINSIDDKMAKNVSG